jgi:hypothetical protein
MKEVFSKGLRRSISIMILLAFVFRFHGRYISKANTYVFWGIVIFTVIAIYIIVNKGRRGRKK